MLDADGVEPGETAPCLGVFELEEDAVLFVITLPDGEKAGVNNYDRYVICLMSEEDEYDRLDDLEGF